MSEALRFWLLAEITGLLALLVAGAFFGRLPGGGLTLARPLGLLLAAYPVWLLASLHLLPYGTGSGWLGMVGLAAVAVGVAAYSWRNGTRPLAALARRPDRNLWLAGELLFLLAFAGWTVLRSYAPDVLGHREADGYGVHQRHQPQPVDAAA